MLTVNFKKSFIDELNHLPPDIKEIMEDLVFNKLSGGEFDNSYPLEKMKGYPGKFQIKTGNLRFGFTFNYETGEIVCEKITHRKDIYKLFNKMLNK